MEWRTKTADSFSEKIARPDKAQKYSHISDVTDISGVRVICYTSEDVDKVCKILSDHFVIDEPNSANREDIIDPDRFGYLSFHYVLLYTRDRLKLHEFKRFADMKVELQVRTILQHTWAAIDWKLRYKSGQEVPRALKRRLYRISALLEAADEDFSAIGNEIDQIRKSYKHSVKRDNYDIAIDKESLEIFVRNSRAVRDLERSAIKSGFSITPPPPNSRNPFLSLMLTVRACNIYRLDELESAINDKNFNEERLKLVYDLWHTSLMPTKLVLDLGGIMRLLLIMKSEKNYGRDILAAHPFGPSLQQAVIAALA